jgi:hypothetical protein
MENDIVALFCDVDDFCQDFEPQLKKLLLHDGTIKRQKRATLCLSEVMTIILWFHQSGYRTFKDYYTKEVAKHLLWAFPHLVSYNRFVELMPSTLLPLCCYLRTKRGVCSGISFVDSMSIAVCHNRRINSHKVFAKVAKRGKDSVDWFYGFKLHMIVNDRGELIAIRLTPANVDDRKPLPKMVKGFFGKLFGDKGYISQELFELLFNQGLQLVTRLRANMKNKLMPMFDKIMLRKRVLIETIQDQLKNISQIEHSRHRSVVNFLVNLVAALIAYSCREKKPSLNIRVSEFSQLPVVLF